MNCKPGDMALVVKSEHGNIGKVVTCIRLATPDESFLFASSLHPYWLTDRGLVHVRSFSGERAILPFAPDAYLMPINPLNDEQTTRETEVTP